MIKVTIDRRSGDRAIEAFRVDGHAMYDESGKDIVCAGVSAVTVGTVNAIEALLGVEPAAKVKHGLLDVRIPEQTDGELHKQIQLLLESMVVMLTSIQQSYGAYIAMQERIDKRRRR